MIPDEHDAGVVREWFGSSRDYAHILDFETDELELLWISGGAGRGKSTFLRAIVSYLTELAKRQMPNVVYHFCGANESSTEHAAFIVRRLIGQILFRRPSLIKHLRAKQKLSERRLFDHPNDFMGLSQILLDILSDDDLPQTYLVLDAIDSCPYHVGWPRLDDFVRLIKSTATFKNVKWIISTRSNEHIGNALRGYVPYKHMDLNSDHDVVSSTLARHIEKEVSKVEKTPQYTSDNTTEIIEKVCQRGGNNLLWITLASKILCLEKNRDGLELLEEIPDDLQSLYEYAIGKIDSLYPEEKSFYRMLLSTMAIVYQPLPVSELSVLSGLPDRIDARVLAEKCYVLLNVQGDSVHFTHPSVRDFIRTKMPPSIGAHPGHAEIARRCLHCLSTFFGKSGHEIACPQLGPNGVLMLDVPEDLPRYSLTHWLVHALEIENLHNDSETLSTIKEFWQEHLLTWLDALSLASCSSVALSLLRKLDLSLRASLSTPADIIHFIRDVHGLLRVNEECGRRGSYNTLLFCPDESLAKNEFMKGAIPWIETAKILMGEPGWREDFQSLQNCSDTKFVGGLTFSPDGRLIASADQDNNIRLYDTETGTFQTTLSGRFQAIRDIAISSTGTIVCCADDNLIRGWTTAADCSSFTQRLPSWVSRLSFSPDLDRFAAVCAKVVKVVDLSTEESRSIVDIPGQPRQVKFSPNGSLLAVSAETEKSCIILYDTGTLKRIRRLDSSMDCVSCIAFSHDSRRLAACHLGRISVWNLPDKAGIDLEGDCGAVSDNDPDFAVNFEDKDDADEEYADADQWTVSFLPGDGSRLISNWPDGLIRIWNVKSKTLEEEDPQISWNPVTALAVSPNERFIASRSKEGVPKFRYFHSKEHMDLSGPEYRAMPGVVSLAVSPDGRFIVSGHELAEISLWHGKTGELLHTYRHMVGDYDATEDKFPVTFVAFSPDSRILMTASEVNRTVTLWDIAETNLCQKQHWLDVNCAAFSADGTLLACGCVSGKIEIMERGPGGEYGLTQVCETNYRLNSISAIAFSPDAKCVVAGSNVGDLCACEVRTTVKIWATKIASPRGQPAAGVVGVGMSVVSASGSLTVAACTDDGHLYTWEAEAGLWRWSLPEMTMKKELGNAVRRLALDPAYPGYVMTELGLMSLGERSEGGVPSLPGGAPSGPGPGPNGSSQVLSPWSSPFSVYWEEGERPKEWWISWKGREFVRIPPKYEPWAKSWTAVCVSGHKVLLGTPTGEIIFLQFSDKEELYT